MPFSFTRCSIEGLYEISPEVFGDNRGYFYESYSQKHFFDVGLKINFVQDNMSFSKKGTLRGLHFQTQNPQEKLVSVINGEVFDVAVDIRKDSKTYGKWHGVLLNGSSHKQFYIPQGFAHGFLVLSDTSLISYKCTDFYNPKAESGIIWNDRKIAIDWPKLDVEYTLSDKDKNWSELYI
ncbi:MAG: dTDP-4-dehydrorhamnose 3,5-epimerase [Elusimicrobiota bacterium]|jgi:dTDP-4-dehydrorhamnose 3,5-epimerase|nr:dTDP-4-dehydrorhamnose 3,5-epimerase [Elusimicrobiota bacterium]